MFLISGCFPKIYDSPSLSRHSQFCLTRSINKMHLIRLLCDIQISEKGQRHSEYRRIFKPLSILKIINHFKVKNVKKLSHISCVTPYRVLVSDLHSLLLTYKSGDCLHELTKITIQICSRITGNLFVGMWIFDLMKGKSLSKILKYKTIGNLQKHYHTF